MKNQEMMEKKELDAMVEEMKKMMAMNNWLPLFVFVLVFLVFETIAYFIVSIFNFQSENK